MNRFFCLNHPANRPVRLLLCLFRFTWLIISAFGPIALAQTTAPVAGQLTLAQCIELALQNNLAVQQGQLTVANSELQLRQARQNLLPTASLFGGQLLNSGRNIDPSTNQFILQTITASNYQLSASATLFNGFALRNTIRQTDLARQASQQELSVIRNTTTLTVIQAYLNVLMATEQLTIAGQQADVARAQIARTERQVAAGTVPEAGLYDLRATLAGNETDIATAQNTFDLAKVTLLQVMNVPTATETGSVNDGIEIAPVALTDLAAGPYPVTVQQVYETALATLPEAKGADLRVRSATVGVAVARGNRLPFVSVNANVNSLFSSAATSAFGYGEQLSNNLNRSFSLNVRVPIFAGNVARNRITFARMQQQTAELDGRVVRQQLRQQIETAYANLRAGANRYRAVQAQTAALEQAFAGADSRFNAGALGAFEYGIAKTSLDRSRSALVQSKYEYVFRGKILDFYQGRLSGL